MGGERHRSIRAQSRRLGGPGWPSAAPGSCSESHGNSGLGQQGGAARGSGGFQACRKRPQAVSCTGLRGASSHIAPSFHGFRCFGAESSSEQLQYSRDFEGAAPLGRRGKSVPRPWRRSSEGGERLEFGSLLSAVRSLDDLEDPRSRVISDHDRLGRAAEGQGIVRPKRDSDCLKPLTVGRRIEAYPGVVRCLYDRLDSCPFHKDATWEQDN